MVRQQVAALVCCDETPPLFFIPLIYERHQGMGVERTLRETKFSIMSTTPSCKPGDSVWKAVEREAAAVQHKTVWAAHPEEVDHCLRHPCIVDRFRFQNTHAEYVTGRG